MLELEDFIAETLPSIVRGIRKGRQDPDCGADVVPLIQGKARNAAGVFYLKDDESKQAVMVDFEISVMAKEADEQAKKAGFRLKVFLADASVGGDKKASTEASSIHKLRFSLSLGLPEN